MGKDLDINSKIQNYIQELSKSLHPVQSEIIFYNKGLGDIKKMQIAISQCYFLELITKTSHAKKILEIGTFTGLSTLSMALGLPDDGTLIALDKNAETNLNYHLPCHAWQWPDPEGEAVAGPFAPVLQPSSCTKDNGPYDIWITLKGWNL